MNKTRLFVTLVSLLGSFSFVSCSNTKLNTVSFGYKYYSDGTAQVCFQKGFNMEEITIPSIANREYNGNVIPYKVTGIYIDDSNCFLNGNRTIKRVNIESEYIIKMPWDVFRDSSVEYVDMSKAKNLTEIGDHVFSGSNLKSVILPPNLKILYKGVFEKTNLTEVTFPDSIIDIGVDTFFLCKDLVKCNLGKSLDFIPGSCFERAYSLQEVICPNVEEIHQFAFVNANKYDGHNLNFSNITKVGQSAFKNTALKGDLVFDDVTIEKHAFEHTMISSVKFNFIDDIPYKAFSDCENLKTVKLPYSLTSIGGSAFKNTAISKIEIPNKVTHIESQAFKDCTSLKEVILSNRLENISTEAFYNTGIENIDFPESLKRIYVRAFQNTKLREVELSSNVSIADNSFPNDCKINRI